MNPLLAELSHRPILEAANASQAAKALDARLTANSTGGVGPIFKPHGPAGSVSGRTAGTSTK